MEALSFLLGIFFCLCLGNLSSTSINPTLLPHIPIGYLPLYQALVILKKKVTPKDQAMEQDLGTNLTRSDFRRQQKIDMTHWMAHKTSKAAINKLVPMKQTLYSTNLCWMLNC
jgi:hypothetical protein